MSNMQMLQAVENDQLAAVEAMLRQGASPNVRNEAGLTPLMIASGQGNAAMVKLLLDAGADVFTVEPRAGGSALHKACQGGNVEVVRLLVEAGAFLDWVAPTTGHTPLMDALWFKWPAIVEYLLQKGAGLNLYTHYGFSLLQHFEYELNVNVIGKERLLEAEKMIRQRQLSDEKEKERQQLMAAVAGNDLEKVQQLIRAGANLEDRYPILNGFNDGHTPLHVAARDGYLQIVAELLDAGANVNAVEPTFGAVPLHKSVYNGHIEITALLVQRPGIDLNFQGATNGYTALHDALWHGYEQCARILIDAGARLDLRGHDGKLPAAIAAEVFGPDHAIVRSIHERTERRASAG